MSAFLGVDPRAMMGTVGGMFAGMAIIYGLEAVGSRLAPQQLSGVLAAAWLAGVGVAVGIARYFSDGDPRAPLFAGGILYLWILSLLFTHPHPVWVMGVGGLGVPLVGAAVWWSTRTPPEDE